MSDARAVIANLLGLDEWYDIDERFWRQVAIDDPEACWVWQGRSRIGRMAYAAFWLEGGREKVAAHRWAFQRYVRPLVDGELALHGCDDVVCVNIATHVHAGTHELNMTEMCERGRSNSLRGPASPKAKLTAAQVVELRHRAADGEARRLLAADYAITTAAVGLIVQGKRYADVWAHVT